jgi:hypothetical protein
VSHGLVPGRRCFAAGVLAPKRMAEPTA